MTLRAILRRLLRSMSPGLDGAGGVPVPFYAAWPGAPVCWGTGFERYGVSAPVRRSPDGAAPR
jgi:hypothetical protein